MPPYSLYIAGYLSVGAPIWCLFVPPKWASSECSLGCRICPLLEPPIAAALGISHSLFLDEIS